jgi:hypothetical protein
VQSLAWRDDARHGPSHGMNGRGSGSGAGPGPSRAVGTGGGPSRATGAGPNRFSMDGAGPGPGSTRGTWQQGGNGSGRPGFGQATNTGRPLGPPEHPPTPAHEPCNRRDVPLPPHGNGAAFQWVKTHGVCQRCLKWPDFQHGSREVSADGQHTQRHDGKGPFWCANPEAAWPPNLAALRQTARANGFADLPRI